MFQRSLQFLSEKQDPAEEEESDRERMCYVKCLYIAECLFVIYLHELLERTVFQLADSAGR